MELILLGGLSIPAFTLVLLMVSFYHSITKINFSLKKTKKHFVPYSRQTIEGWDKRKNSEFNHLDFSDGMLGI